MHNYKYRIGYWYQIILAKNILIYKIIGKTFYHLISNCSWDIIPTGLSTFEDP